MKNARRWSKTLLWLHLFVCVVWLCLFRSTEQPPGWMIHVYILSILGIQFSWGFTVGLIVGPSRKRRPLLWWSLLTVFMPIYVVSHLFIFLALFMGLPVALLYLAVFIAILASETFGGVLLGAQAHNGGEK